MTLILYVGRNMKLMTTLNLCLMLLKKILDINYTYGSLKQLMEKHLVEGNIIFIYQIMGERGGGYSEQKEDDQKGKYLAKEMMAYILASHVIGEETWLHYVGGIAV